eukprot:11195957-Lingulodinium_polyedra.AAC.1
MGPPPGEQGDGRDVLALPAGGVRPLQIPIINRRHLGSYWAECAAPAVEPDLSQHQAAIRGGG